MAKQVEYTIVVNDKGTATLKSIGQASQEAHGHITALSEGVGNLGRTVIGLAGAYAGISVIKDSIDIYREERNELVKLSQVYKDNSSATNLSLQQLKDMAKHQEELTGIHAGVTEQVEVNLLKHRDLKVAYESLIPVIEDFAKTSGRDASEASDIFGRALANPSRAMRVLMQAGVDLTDKERKRLDVLAKMNDTTKAQTMLFDLLKDKYAGVAAVMYANDPEEQLAEHYREASLELGHFEEELLVDLMPTIQSIINHIQKWIVWGEKHKKIIEETAKDVGILVAVLASYKTAVEVAETATEAWDLVKMVTGIGEVKEATEGLTGSVKALNGAMELNPFGLIVAGIAGVGFALNAWWHSGTKEEIGSQAQIEGDKKDAAAWEKKKKEIEANSATIIADYQTESKKEQQQEIKGVQSNLAFYKKKYDDENIYVNPDKQKLEHAREGMYGAQYLLSQFQNKNTASVGSGKDSGNLKVTEPDAQQGDKHTIITFNIKQFGAEKIEVNGPEEVGKKAGENMLKSLLQAINDSQTTADIH